MKIVKHIAYDEEYELDEDANGMPLEPKCPECGSIATRQKCMWELGGGCPRHGIADVYREEKLKWAAANLPEGCLCPNHRKAQDKWPAEHWPHAMSDQPACPLAKSSS